MSFRDAKFSALNFGQLNNSCIPARGLRPIPLGGGGAVGAEARIAPQEAERVQGGGAEMGGTPALPHKPGREVGNQPGFRPTIPSSPGLYSQGGCTGGRAFSWEEGLKHLSESQRSLY